MIDIMIDIETWGTKPGSDIRSIGACKFDPISGEVFEWGDNTFYIACDNPTGYWTGRYHTLFAPTHDNSGRYKYPLTRDPETVKWRSEQSDDAQAAFSNPLDLKGSLERFRYWLLSFGITYINPTDYRIWSHGPAFDPVLLAAAYDAVDLPLPWHYRTLRDTRTLFDAAGIDDHTAWLAQYPGPLGIPHHAICQARAVCAAWGIKDSDKR